MADPQKLPVFETIGSAITYSLKNIVLMIKLSWLWAVVVIVVAAAVFVVANATGGLGADDATAMNSTMVAGLVIIIPVYMIALYSVAVGWHRALLLGEQPGWFHLHVGRREFAYLGYTFAIFLTAGLGMAIAAGIAGLAAGVGRESGVAAVIAVIAVVAGLVLMVLVLGRLHLVLPGAAVGDRRMSIGRSYELTRGNTWRIAGGFILITLLNGVVNVFSGLLEASADSTSVAAIIAFAIVVVLASMIVGFIALSYMSYCYWHFVPPPEEGDLS